MEEKCADSFVGEAGETASRLIALALHLQVDELIVCGWTHDEAARHQSYQQLIEAVAAGA
jgi:hypothetical protein